MFLRLLLLFYLSCSVCPVPFVLFISVTDRRECSPLFRRCKGTDFFSILQFFRQNYSNYFLATLFMGCTVAVKGPHRCCQRAAPLLPAGYAGIMPAVDVPSAGFQLSTSDFLLSTQKDFRLKRTLGSKGLSAQKDSRLSGSHISAYYIM